MAQIADGSPSEPPDRPEATLHVVQPGETPPPVAGGADDGGLRAEWPSLLVLLSGAVVLILVLLDAPTPLRIGPVLGYIAVVPGLACVRLARIPDRFTELLLGVTLSFALGIIVAQLMIYAHLWSPALGLTTLVIVASAAAVIDLASARLASWLRRWAGRST